MLIWKKPIALLVATTGIFVGAVGPEHASAQLQNTSKSTFHNFNDTATKPTPASILQTTAIKTAQPFCDSDETPTRSQDTQKASLLQAIETTPTTLSMTENPVGQPNSFQSTGFAAPQESSSPNAISQAGIPTQDLETRTQAPGTPTQEGIAFQTPTADLADIPAADPGTSSNEVGLDIERVPNGETEQGFTIRLRVPDSVKVVEVTPQSNRDNQRNFKIQLDQNHSQPSPSDGLITSTYSMPSAPAAGPTRFLKTAHPINSATESTTNTRPAKWIRGNTESPTSRGFQKNPYFKSAHAHEKPLAMAPAQSVLEELPEPFVPPIRSVKSVLADPEFVSRHAFQTELHSADSGTHSAQQTSFQPPAAEATNMVSSAITGPADLGVGESGDFTICVTNPTAHIVENVTVTLDVPQGFELVFLDREAEFDVESYILSKRFDQLSPRDKQIIRYRLKSVMDGDQVQRVQVSSETGNLSTAKLSTSVSVGS